MAIGEAACVSVHRANRLGSNSLIDLVVFGRAAGRHIKQDIKSGHRSELSKGNIEKSIDVLRRLDSSKSGESVFDLKSDMQKTMQNHCAVFRTGEGLKKGSKKMDEILDEMKSDDYEHLIQTFDKYFGKVVDLER